MVLTKISSACTNVTALVRAAECDVVCKSLNLLPLDNFMDTTFLCSGPSTSLQATSHLNGSTPMAVSPVLTLTSSKHSMFLSQPPRPLCFLCSPACSMLAVTHLPFQRSSLCQSHSTLPCSTYSRWTPGSPGGFGGLQVDSTRIPQK